MACHWSRACEGWAASIHSFANSEAAFVVAVPFAKCIENLLKEARRQESIIVAIGASRFPQIVAGPHELIALAHSDP